MQWAIVRAVSDQSNQPEGPDPLLVEIEVSGDSEREADRSLRGLLAEIRELEVESASLKKTGEAPPAGTKAGELLTASSILAAISAGFAPKLIELLLEWKSRRRHKNLRLKVRSKGRTIDLSYFSKSEDKEDVASMVRSLLQASHEIEATEP